MNYEQAEQIKCMVKDCRFIRNKECHLLITNCQPSWFYCSRREKKQTEGQIKGATDLFLKFLGQNSLPKLEKMK